MNFPSLSLSAGVLALLLLTGCASAGDSTTATIAPTFTPDWSKFPSVKGASPEIKIIKVSTGGTLHRFFDTSPFSPSGRYLALFRFPQENLSPRAGEAGEVILVDLQTGTQRVVAESRGYEMQLGANVQWGATDDNLFFNDVDPKTSRAFAVHLNPFTGVSRKMDGTVFMVSPDGKQLASYNLVNSRRAQVGYGVIVPDAAMPPRQFGPSDDAGVVLTDVATGKARTLVTIRDIYERAQPSLKIPHPEDYEFYCFQTKWNPQGTRLLTTLQWSPREQNQNLTSGAKSRMRAVITMRPDGSDLRAAITPDQWAKGGHHINWMADGEHLSMNLNVGEDPGLKIISVKADGSDLKIIYQPGSGHPSQHPSGNPWFITDAYPDEPVSSLDGTSPLRLINTETKTEQRVINIFVSMTGGEFRVDPHPAWDRTGRFIAFNGFADNTRNVFVADVSALMQRSEKVPDSKRP